MTKIEEIEKRLYDLEITTSGLRKDYDELFIALEKQKHDFPYIGDKVYFVTFGANSMNFPEFKVQIVEKLTKEQYESREYYALIKNGYAFDNIEEADKLAVKLNKEIEKAKKS